MHPLFIGILLFEKSSNERDGGVTYQGRIKLKLNEAFTIAVYSLSG